MFRNLTLIVMAVALSTSTLLAADVGGECKVGMNVSSQYLCSSNKPCLTAISKMYCSNAGMTCGWSGTGGQTLGATKTYNDKEYVCTATGFKLKAGEQCSSGSGCTTGLCLNSIGNSYCSNLGMICGWGGTGGYTLNTKKTYNGKEYVCTPSGFKLSVGEACSTASQCGSGLCLNSIGNSRYCSNVGMTCGWAGTGGYTIGNKKQHLGKEYTCFADGFAEKEILPQVRSLTSAERAIINSVFGNSVNASQVRVTDTVGSSGRPWTTNSPPLYTINVGDAYSSLSSTYKALLVHEMAHVWQGQNGVPFMSNSTYHQTLSAIANGGDVGQAYEYVAGKQWSKYNVEQQASLVEDWYTTGMSKTSKLYPYIRDNVQTGQPNAVTKFR